MATSFRTDATGRRLPDAAVPAIEIAARHYRARDFDAAARVCDEILALQPRDFDALHLRGVLHLEQRQPALALECLRRAEQAQPDQAQLLFHIGNALQALDRHAEAATAFRRSLALYPGNADTLNNLGNALSGDGQHSAAIDCFRQAVAIRPHAAPSLYNLGRALVAVDRLAEAVESFRAAMAAAGPDTEPNRLIDLHNSLGEALVQLGRYDEALAVCRGAPASIADAPQLRWNTALTLLMLGAYAEGWRHYECRFLVPEHDPPRAEAKALEQSNVAGQRVLVFPEQGRGDMIQFARYLPLLAARGAVVLVEMYADLMPLFAMLDGVAQVVAFEAPSPEHDLLTPLLSLPLAFGTTLVNIPAQVPYLRVPPAHAMRWAGALGPRAGLRVGIAWRGSAKSAPRSALQLPLLEPLLRLDGFEFHCLQQQILPEDRVWADAGGGIAWHDAALHDFADTAALIAQMDLVISIDTSVAHLAGALGKPVWIMLPFSPDWRWLRDREDSPWYPTARLFRQATRGDWNDVVRRVAAALSIECFEHQVEGDQHGIVAADQ